ncbi:MAG: hypothetical protein H0V27_08120 [Pyrinomonadaceae bacterium]|nr:hypothetical protein [Pyrinomonadaceae bacterium]
MHQHWGSEVEFVDVVIRQAHPGPDVPTYHSFEQKMRDAEKYKREDRIAWAVLVDDLPGTTHQVYGGLADPTYIIDAEGRVAFYSLWTHAPTLHTSLEMLRTQGWRGVVNGGVDKRPHVAAAMTDGWKGLRRGLPQSLIDIETAAPTTGVGTWLGFQLRPLIAPLTLRAKPLPASARLGLGVGAAALLLFGVRALTRNRKSYVSENRRLKARPRGHR